VVIHTGTVVYPSLVNLLKPHRTNCPSYN